MFSRFCSNPAWFVAAHLYRLMTVIAHVLEFEHVEKLEIVWNQAHTDCTIRLPTWTPPLKSQSHLNPQPHPLTQTPPLRSQPHSKIVCPLPPGLPSEPTTNQPHQPNFNPTAKQRARVIQPVLTSTQTPPLEPKPHSTTASPLCTDWSRPTFSSLTASRRTLPSW